MERNLPYLGIPNNNVQAGSSEVLTVSPVWIAGCEITALLNAVKMADTVIAVSGKDDALLPLALRYAERLNPQIIRLGTVLLDKQWPIL